jgi:hypothetical protein
MTRNVEDHTLDPFQLLGIKQVFQGQFEARTVEVVGVVHRSGRKSGQTFGEGAHRELLRLVIDTGPGLLEDEQSV